MNKEILKHLVLSALLHDIGKLMERAELFPESLKDPEYISRCPKKGDGVTHLHCAYTASFCDWLEDRFDVLRSTDIKDWKIWASAHHLESEISLEAKVVRIADRLSSSEREPGTYYKHDIHKKTLLEPIVERVFLYKNTKTATFNRYDLKKLTLEKESSFPKGPEHLNLTTMDEPERGLQSLDEWNHLLSREPLTDRYRNLAQEFMADIDTLSNNCPDIPLNDLISIILMLLEKYTSMVPSATNVRHPDISLFDHLRTSSAISQALYLYHSAQDDPSNGIATEHDPKWILVCGDFSGIQRFIYNLTNRGAAKGLRGRSFYVQYICQICADFIIDELNLTEVALLYNSGGKFYMLLPAHIKDQLIDIRKRINKWLIEEFNGEVFLGLGITPVTATMFHEGNLHTAWREVAEDLEMDRTRKFREFFTSEFFEPEAEFDPTKSCSVCGSRKIKAQQADKCNTCKNLETLGVKLKDTNAILTLKQDNVKEIKATLGLKDDRIISFPEIKYHCLLIKEMKNIPSLPRIKGKLVFLNEYADKSLSNLPIPGFGFSGMYLGKWESRLQIHKNGEPWDFEDYANNSEGIKRLGILRMDVDNLGLVFIKGLSFPRRSSITVNGKEKEGWGDVLKDPETGKILRKSMASISRMVTLSRQLNHFFSGYVPTLLKDDKFNQCQVVYAGGDDLFVIGSWNQLPELAKRIHSEFKEFCCNNPDFSISGGIILQRGKYPIYKGAQLAGEAESKAKSLRKDWGKAEHQNEKAGFCFLGVPVLWEDFKLAELIKDMLEAEIKEGNRAMLSYLLNLTKANRLKAEVISIKNGKNMARAWEELKYREWRWQTAYQLKRRYEDESKREKWADIMFDSKFNGMKAKIDIYTWLELPVRWAEFLNREKGGKS